MKYRTILACILFSTTAAVQAASLCQEKEQEILREISYAEKHHNQNRINGLNNALREVRANCSDSDLRAKHQQKISELHAEISERRAELKQAQQSGDREKISKRERKLKEAEEELQALKARDF
ncbi:DUF1090 domain-containing protein [Atlantibacter hermannii]|uniref:DUF1090 domain-containing protein n=1 Tax=Atlantibacter hermannii TaxID=565 RepID=UPI0005C17839|nr:DUF1090 domain-containing protein [Atlantibacter hermannii]KIU33454.1 hypothetical protein SR38_11290 [Atlantibacter hermannii]MDQ7881987.1 DUF1090 domain-containing protein [Atlantibacter hermannii]